MSTTREIYAAASALAGTFLGAGGLHAWQGSFYDGQVTVMVWQDTSPAELWLVEQLQPVTHTLGLVLDLVPGPWGIEPGQKRDEVGR